MPQNISSVEDIVSAALFIHQAKQNGETFPTHVHPSPVAINKRDFGDVQLMEHFCHSYGVGSVAYHQVERTIE